MHSPILGQFDVTRTFQIAPRDAHDNAATDAVVVIAKT